MLQKREHKNDLYFKNGNYYNRVSEQGILWNDSTLNIDWGIKNPLLSEKELVNTTFLDFDSPFNYESNIQSR